MTKLKLHKSDKKYSEDYSQMLCTSSELDNTPAKLKKKRLKLLEELRSQDTQCLSICFLEAEPKYDYVQTVKKVTKFDLGITT